MKDNGEHKLTGLNLFTDETGILQHSKFGVIDRRHGYCTDDNSRALIAAIRHHKIYGGSKSLVLAKRYLEFLFFMHIEGDGFHNFLSHVYLSLILCTEFVCGFTPVILSGWNPNFRCSSLHPPRRRNLRHPKQCPANPGTSRRRPPEQQFGNSDLAHA